MFAIVTFIFMPVIVIALSRRCWPLSLWVPFVYLSVYAGFVFRKHRLSPVLPTPTWMAVQICRHPRTLTLTGALRLPLAYISSVVMCPQISLSV
jgi:hypothetical protein